MYVYGKFSCIVLIDSFFADHNVFQDLDAAYDRGVEEGRSTMKTISQASYERGLKEGKAAVSEPTAINEGAVKAKVTDEVILAILTVLSR